MNSIKTTQSSDSTTEQHAETTPSRSRRRFLKQAAATSILGMSGLTVATESASATDLSDSPSDIEPAAPSDEARDLSEPPEPGTTIESMDLEAAAFDTGIKVFGQSPFTHHYGIFTEGRIVRGKSAEPSDNPDNIGSNNVIGELTAWGYDGFLYNGSLRSVETFKSSVGYRLYDMS